jgi:PAS domain S-box-containing protein
MNAQLLKVLLVEDNIKEAKLFEEFLSEARRIHFELTCVQRLDETLRLLEQNSFDVILLDLSLPDSQGLETVESLRSKALLTPIVVLNGLDDEELAVNAIRAGAQDYLIKGQVDSPLLVHAMRYAIERTQMLQKLHESEERYALAISGGQVGVWQVNFLTLDLYISPNMKALLGYADHEIGIAAEDWLNLVHPDDQQAVLTAAIDHLQGLTPHLEIEHRLLHKDGSSRWVLSRGKAARDATGKPYRMAGSSTDITRHKQAEAALQLSQERYALAANAGKVGVWDWNLETREIYLDPSLKAILGYADEEIRNYIEDWSALVHPDDQSAVMAAVQTHLAGLTPQFEMEHRMLHKDGSIRWILARGTAIYNAEGKPYRITGTDTDITERKQAQIALNESQQRISSIVESITDAFYVLNHQWQFTYINSQAAQLWNCTPEELLGKHLWEEFPEAINSNFFEQYYRAKTEQVAVTFEQFCSGCNRWYEVRVYPSLDGLCVCLHDISDRKQAEAILVERSRQTALAADIGFTLTQGSSLSMMLKQCVLALVQHLDIALARIWLFQERQHRLELEASAGVCTQPDIAPERLFIERFQEGNLARERQPQRIDYLLDEPDLENRDWVVGEGMVSFLGYPLVVENQLVGAIALFDRQPLTSATFNAVASVADEMALGIQRKQVEQALERERQQLREIIANAPVAIAMFDREQRCLVHSQKWATDYDLEGQSIVGRTLNEVFSDLPNHWQIIVQRALKGEILSQSEDKWQRYNGSILYLRWAVQPWSTPEGAVGGFVIATDRINELVEAREAALENSRLKSQFLANMSHEIRTPMNGVLGMTELLAKTELNREQLDFVQTLRTSAENLLMLLNDILDFSKLEAKEMRLEQQEFDLNRCIEDVVDLFSASAQSKKLELAVLIDHNVPRQFIGDAHRLRQILMNLVGNAIKFTDSGEVVIGVSLEFETSNSAEVRFSVTDTGIGIAPSDQKKLFQSFSQVDTSTTRQFGGTGLGLAICQQLVRLMGGEIGVASRGAAFVPGHWSVSLDMLPRENQKEWRYGAKAFLSSDPEQPRAIPPSRRLPLLLSSEPQTPYPQQGAMFWFTVPLGKCVATPITSSSAVELAGVRLLIMSGNTTIRQVVHSLATFWGMQVEEASNCQEFLTIWNSLEHQQLWVDVAILDLNLLQEETPSVQAVLALVQKTSQTSEEVADVECIHRQWTSGSLLTSVKKEDSRQPTKWLMMNSPQERSLALRLMDLGFCGCITKPLKASKLLGCLQQVLVPLNSSDVAVDSCELELAAIAPQTKAYRSQIKILLVEDTPTNQKVLLNQLKVLGYLADCAANGQEALDLLTRSSGYQKQKPEDGEPRRTFSLSSSSPPFPVLLPPPTVPAYDIVLMDCQMPMMDGYEATRLLRAFEGESCRTVVIAMTANAMLGDREKCLAANMDDYISKPITLKELETVLERWIPQRVRNREERTANSLRVNRPSLNLVSSQDYSVSTSLKYSSPPIAQKEEIPIDLERLSEFSQGDREFQHELLEIFLEDAQVYLDQLKNALSCNDFMTLAHRAHQLKGSSATVAVYKMPELAAQLEHQAQAHQLSNVSGLISELEQILERIQAFLVQEGVQ